jgi:hypothetical protein
MDYESPDSAANNAVNQISTYVGYKIGWRWWRLRFGNPHGIVVSTFRWDWTKENQSREPFYSYHHSYWGAEEFADEENPLTFPSLDNETGLYAFKETHIELPPPLVCDPLGFSESDIRLFGKVALYGQVVEHEFGYRAQKARILDVWCKSSVTEQLEGTNRVRGVFVVQEDQICLISGSQKRSKSGNRLNFPITCLKLR